PIFFGADAWIRRESKRVGCGRGFLICSDTSARCPPSGRLSRADRALSLSIRARSRAGHSTIFANESSSQSGDAMSRRLRKRRRTKGSTAPQLLYWGFLGVCGAIVFTSLLFWYFSKDLPSVDTLKEYKPPQVTKILDVKRRLIGELYTERRTVVPLDQ